MILWEDMSDYGGWNKDIQTYKRIIWEYESVRTDDWSIWEHMWEKYGSLRRDVCIQCDMIVNVPYKQVLERFEEWGELLYWGKNDQIHWIHT